MATIKAYTDLEQSKKLAEILPLESADMYYPWYIEDDGDTIESGHRITTPNIGNFTTHKINKMILPCWSLAALFAFLPKSAFLERGNVTELYRITLTIELVSFDWFVEPIDACVAMIEKLHELNLL